MLDAKTRALILASPWLFLLHEYEEYRTAVPWLKANAYTIPEVLRAYLPKNPSVFLYGGLVFFIVYFAAGYFATRPGAKNWTVLLVALLMIARLENALTHLIQFGLLRRYTPGVITALVIVLPVSAFLIWRFARFAYVSRRSWLKLIIAASGLHVVAIGLILLAF